MIFFCFVLFCFFFFAILRPNVCFAAKTLEHRGSEKMKKPKKEKKTESLTDNLSALSERTTKPEIQQRIKS